MGLLRLLAKVPWAVVLLLVAICRMAGAGEDDAEQGRRTLMGGWGPQHPLKPTARFWAGEEMHHPYGGPRVRGW